jgi:hypothetical protein
LQPNGQTYLSFLRHWFDNPQKYDQNQQTDTNEKMMTGETLLAHGWNVYEDYERYRRLQGLPERWEELEVKYLRNKWQQLGITHDHRRIEYDIYRYTIAGLAKHNDLVRATRLLGILLERGHARVTNMMHLRPDHYSPTRHSSTDHGVQADQLRFSQFPVHPAVIEASPEVDRSLFDKSDGSSTEINNINNSTLLLQKYTSPHVRHSGVDDSQLNPSYAQPSVQFRPRDFQLLLNRVRDAGDKSLLSRVESLLDMARRTSGRQERLASSQMQQVKDRLRKRWY